MLRDIIAMIAVQSPDGMLFGTARKFDGETLHCEIDADILPGTLVEWRMELPGLDDTALGKMRIIGVQRLGNTGVRLWSGTIVAVDGEDEEVFSVWKRGVDEGSRSFAKSRHQSGSTDWLSGQGSSGTTPAERARAMALQEERRKRRADRARQLAKNAKAWPDPDERTAGAAIAQEVYRPLLSGSGSGGVPVRPPSSYTGSTSTTVEYSRPRAQVAETLRTHMRRAGAHGTVGPPARDEEMSCEPTGVATEPPAVNLDTSSELAAPSADVQPAPPVAPLPTAEAGVGTAEDPGETRSPPSFLGGIADAVERVQARTRAQAPKRGKASERQVEATLPAADATPTGPVADAPGKRTGKGASRSKLAPPPAEPVAAEPGLSALQEEQAPAPAAAPAAPTDPVVHADNGMLSVWFVSPAAYRSQAAGIRAGRLELSQDGLGKPGAPLQIYLRVPSGVVLPLSGSVIFSGGGITGLRLNIDATNQKLIDMG